jgi:hypothetical protein
MEYNEKQIQILEEVKGFFLKRVLMEHPLEK